MLTPKQALKVIFEKTVPLKALTLPLTESLGLRLAGPVVAPHPYPLFDNAALDGYAVRSRDTGTAVPGLPLRLKIVGSQFAGQSWTRRLATDQALHVTTGAPMPAGADALVPYESVQVQGGSIELRGPAWLGQNVRRRGEDAKRGHLLVSAGTRLNARHIAMLAAFGVETVKIYPKPRVAVAVSGDELIAPGQRLGRGKIFDSNSPALTALLTESGYKALALVHLPDKRGTQTARLRALLKTCDVLLVAGGMSVGERDLGKNLLEALGVRRVFWKVAQKPGKPLYFGIRGKQLIFGLPGNPAAVISCFVTYVLPALKALSFEERTKPKMLPLAHALPGTKDKALLLKAQIDGQGANAHVRILSGQGSHLLRSLAEGNALVVRMAGDPALKKGQAVTVLPL